MAQWGKVDSANTALSGKPVKMLKSSSVQTVSNGVSYVGANTANITYGVDKSETAAAAGAVPHAGWVLVKEGTGGRAGRKQYEVLVAMSSITGDADSNTATVTP
jgi:hypothetical protein